QGTSVNVERSPIAMYSGPCGPMPRPQIAKPAKPAPVVSTSSKCATGMHFACGEPWMSTNCARTNLIACRSRNFLAWASVIAVSPIVSADVQRSELPPDRLAALAVRQILELEVGLGD